MLVFRNGMSVLSCMAQGFAGPGCNPPLRGPGQSWLQTMQPGLTVVLLTSPRLLPA